MDARESAIFVFAWKGNYLAFAGFLHLLREFGARKHFTDHHTPNTIHSFGLFQFSSVKWTTVTVRYAKISSNISFFPIQATQAGTMDRQDENKPLQNLFKHI